MNQAPRYNTTMNELWSFLREKSYSLPQKPIHETHNPHPAFGDPGAAQPQKTISSQPQATSYPGDNYPDIFLTFLKRHEHELSVWGSIRLTGTHV